MRLFRLTLLLMLVCSLVPAALFGFQSLRSTRALLIRDVQELHQERVKQLRLRTEALLDPPLRSVQVAADGGATEVTAHSGTPVRVSAQGVTRAVHAGHAVRVERGEAPPVAGPTRPPRVALGIPLPVSPASGELLRQRPVGRGLEPVTVRWTAVEGADGYVVTLARGSRRWTVRSTRLDAQLPSMRPGTYRWSVRAVLGDQEGEASAPVRFRIEEEPLELEVKGSGWK